MLILTPDYTYSFIVPDPEEEHDVRVHPSFGDHLYAAQGWLAIKHDRRQIDYRHSLGYFRVAEPRFTLQTLRALSHTCRSLRAYTLPILWAVVHVETVHELGKLRDALRDAPHIAPLIRHFMFTWDMNEDEDKCEPYPDEHGSLLDMAFIDRGALWQSMRSVQDHPLLFYPREAIRPFVYFTEGGENWDQPGYALNHPLEVEVEAREYRIKRAKLEPQDEKHLEERENARRASTKIIYENHWPHTNASGPDGNGMDLRIKSPQDFRECLSEVVAQLSSLSLFSWGSKIVCVPLGAFEALKAAPRLTHLDINFQTLRKGVCTGESNDADVVLASLPDDICYFSLCSSSSLGAESKTWVSLDALQPMPRRRSLEHRRDLRRRAYLVRTSLCLFCQHDIGSQLVESLRHLPHHHCCS